jgi:hypothetical protein
MMSAPTHTEATELIPIDRGDDDALGFSFLPIVAESSEPY